MTAIETVKSFYESLGRGDVGAVVALLADPLEWTEAELGRAIFYYDRKLNEQFLSVTT